MRLRKREKPSDVLPGRDHRYSVRVDRRLWSNFDWSLLFLSASLAVIGIVNLYSATYGSVYEGLYYIQLSSLAFSSIALLLAFLIPYRYFEATSYWIFLVAVLLLAVVLATGRVAHGAQRWIALGPISFQPSELMKIALAMALARYFGANPNYRGYGIRELILPAAITGLPVILILLEPDLGTAIMHILLFLTVVLFMHVRKSTVWFTLITFLLMIPVGWFFVLKDYQKERILTLFNSSRDPLGAGYHIRQSIIAVGSGRWTGKGLLQGTQTKLQFLPEHHTDFIFSVFAEEWGLLGCAVLLLLYFLLLLKGVTIAVQSKDRYGSILAFGLTTILFWHVAINLMMVMGLAPVVGVTLPFFSYGRTSLITIVIIVGLLLNISSRRYMFEQL